jgi:hypothetical protein
MSQTKDADGFLERRLEATKVRDRRATLYWAARAYTAAEDAGALDDRSRFTLVRLVKSDAELLLGEEAKHRCFFCRKEHQPTDLIGTSMQSIICKSCVLKYADDIRAGRW